MRPSGFLGIRYCLSPTGMGIYISFPTISADPGSFVERPHDGHKAQADRSPAFSRSSAARAAHRRQRRLPHLLQRAMACEISFASLWMFGDVSRGGCWVRRGIASYKQGDHYGLSGIGTLQQMWELACQRCAVRTALDLEGAARTSSYTAMRRAGGARSQGRQKSHEHLLALMRSTDGPSHLKRCVDTHASSHKASQRRTSVRGRLPAL